MRLPQLSILVLAMALTACGNRNGDVTLTRIKNTGNGPDEFSILPGKPLQAPESFSALPAPNPGGANLTDQNPKADGVVALGGNPAAQNGGISSADVSLVRHAGRYGSQPGVRQTLRAEDQDTRRRYGRRNILRIGPTDDYTDAYKRQWLDSHQTQERLRQRGIQTPSAPPPT